jgi:hypothetical protein
MKTQTNKQTNNENTNRQKKKTTNIQIINEK